MQLDENAYEAKAPGGYTFILIDEEHSGKGTMVVEEEIRLGLISCVNVLKCFEDHFLAIAFIQSGIWFRLSVSVLSNNSFLSK